MTRRTVDGAIDNLWKAFHRPGSGRGRRQATAPKDTSNRSHHMTTLVYAVGPTPAGTTWFWSPRATSPRPHDDMTVGDLTVGQPRGAPGRSEPRRQARQRTVGGEV